MRILIDTNVILDILQKREPFFADSYRALRKAIESDTECLISASAATDIFYMLRKTLGSAQQAKDQIEQLAQLVSFADVQGMDIHTALMRAMPDFEDCGGGCCGRAEWCQLHPYPQHQGLRRFGGASHPSRRFPESVSVPPLLNGWRYFSTCSDGVWSSVKVSTDPAQIKKSTRNQPCQPGSFQGQMEE